MAYVPILGYLYHLIKSEQQYGDSWAFVRKIKEQNPDIKVIVTNFRSDIMIIPIGETFNKDVLLNNALTLYK